MGVGVVDENEAEILKRLQSLDAENKESIKQLEEAEDKAEKLKEYIAKNFQL